MKRVLFLTIAMQCAKNYNKVDFDWIKIQRRKKILYIRGQSVRFLIDIKVPLAHQSCIKLSNIIKITVKQ